MWREQPTATGHLSADFLQAIGTAFKAPLQPVLKDSGRMMPVAIRAQINLPHQGLTLGPISVRKVDRKRRLF